MSFSPRLRGIPRETISACGETPFEAKSLTHMATAFRPACLQVIPGGTSVLPTSMSAFRTSLPGELGRVATSSPIGE